MARKGSSMGPARPLCCHPDGDIRPFPVPLGWRPGGELPRESIRSAGLGCRLLPGGTGGREEKE